MTTTQSEKDRVVIFDTTLRDGEQCPGATMTHEEKLEVAELPDQLGVDIIEARASTIKIPDTVGYTVPEEYFEMFRKVREAVPNSDKAVFSVHCHNDLGMAVANSLAGVKAGCRQIECTINGIGERAGNTALEEVVMAMRVRNDVLPFWTKIDATMLTRASKLVAAATSFPVQYNKAIVGRNAFAHESGIHQDGMLKNAQTYEIMVPETVGVKQTSMVMGKD